MITAVRSITKLTRIDISYFNYSQNVNAILANFREAPSYPISYLQFELEIVDIFVGGVGENLRMFRAKFEVR